MKTEVEDPVLVEERTADSRGRIRISLGKEYAGKEYKVVIAENTDDN